MPYSTPEKRRAYAKRWHAANRDHVSIRARAYYLAHRDEMSAYRSKWQKDNKEKLNAYQRARYAANKAKYRRQARARYAKNVVAKRAYQLVAYAKAYKEGRKFGKRPAAPYPPPSKCECCGKKSVKRLSFDHCHKTAKFRGWICSNCNLGLGLFGDTLAGVRQAMKYLQRKI